MRAVRSIRIGKISAGYRVLLASLSIVLLISSALSGCGASSSSSAASRATPPTQSIRPSVAASSGSSSFPASPQAANPTATGSATVHPGHDTPQDAVDGYMTAILAGNPAAACSYVEPSKQAECTSVDPANGNSGSFTIRSAMISTSGILATVAITGSICSQDAGCATNTDPSTGMPADPAQVEQAIAKMTVNRTNQLSPIPCIFDRGWYLYSP